MILRLLLALAAAHPVAADTDLGDRLAAAFVKTYEPRGAFEGCQFHIEDQFLGQPLHGSLWLADLDINALDTTTREGAPPDHLALRVRSDTLADNADNLARLNEALDGYRYVMYPHGLDWDLDEVVSVHKAVGEGLAAGIYGDVAKRNQVWFIGTGGERIILMTAADLAIGIEVTSDHDQLVADLRAHRLEHCPD